MRWQAMSADLGAALREALEQIANGHDLEHKDLRRIAREALAARPVERPPQGPPEIQCEHQNPVTKRRWIHDGSGGCTWPFWAIEQAAPGVEALAIAKVIAQDLADMTDCVCGPDGERYRTKDGWQHDCRFVHEAEARIAAALTGKAGEGPLGPTERGARQP